MELKNEGVDDQQFVESVKEDVLNDAIYVLHHKGTL